ncbi:NrdH-redoxin [Candidatus Woesearchaeota archaeon]|jgi:glutaredoxin 3|nr:NrdH-redoxin [Candidatus Woesearchaeota archaeon]
MTVKVYSTPTCPWCKKLKAWLKENKIAFKDLNVAEDEKARAEMIEKSGQMGVPVTDINGTITVGFDEKKLEELLKKK